MGPECLSQGFFEILESGTFPKICPRGNSPICLDDDQMFSLWNSLGEELGIDLSQISDKQRAEVFEACSNGRYLVPNQFASLLWLVFYSEFYI